MCNLLTLVAKLRLYPEYLLADLQFNLDFEGNGSKILSPKSFCNDATDLTDEIQFSLVGYLLEYLK
tara:strand:- start:102 stop:299 length:198 start_codon:yes stop_codon:yes gene_type:complete